MKASLSSRDWFGKASAGTVLGLVIALGLSGLLAKALGADDTYYSLPGQVTMWMIAPVWCFILSFCFLFRSGTRAWLILGLISAVIWSGVAILATMATGIGVTA